jgi:hypothetical protein
MLRNMAVISQNITKKNEKIKNCKKDKNKKLTKPGFPDKNELLTPGPSSRPDQVETSLYSACILSANCLSSAANMLTEVSGEPT